MPKPPLLWVHKNASSKQLSHSSSDETTLIRRHVQTPARISKRSERVGNRPLRPLGTLAPSIHAESSQDTRSPRDTAIDLIAAAQCQDATDKEAHHKFDGVVLAQSSNSFLLDCLPSHTLVSTLCLTNDEARGLLFYQRHTAKEWSGWGDYELWNRVALQLGHSNRGIVHALVSFATLQESSAYEISSSQYATLHDLAVKQWSKALKLCSTMKSEHTDALLSCIVLACLQQLHTGESGYQLIAVARQLLEELNHQVSLGLSHLTYSQSTVIDTVLRSAIERLHARVCTTANPVAALKNSIEQARINFWFQSSESLPTIPKSFQTLHQAREYLLAIFQWGHDIAARRLARCVPQAFDCFLLRLSCASWERALSLTHHSDIEKSEFPSLEHFDRAKKLLMIASCYGRILLETYDSQSESIYDHYTADFQKMVDMLTSAQDPRTSKVTQCFGIDNGLIEIITWIGYKCRDPFIRRKALAFLKDGKRIEGDRNAIVGSMLLKALIKLEENGQNVATCQDVPESNRCRVLIGHQHPGTGRIRLVLLRSPYDENDPNCIQEIWVRIGVAQFRREAHSTGNALDCEAKPSVVFGQAYAAFLDSEDSQRYKKIRQQRFIFPVPKV